MKTKDVVQLEKLLMELELYLLKNRQPGTFQVGKYVVQPIYWGENEDGEIIIDKESMLDEFEDTLENCINTNFVESL